MTITNLLTDGLYNPIGLGQARPRLSWTQLSPPAGFQIRAAARLEDLAQDNASQASLWDSGRLQADDSPGVQWGGRPLHSRQRVYWQVRAWEAAAWDAAAWEAAGQPGPWSEPASFEMGLLDPADWMAGWIGAPDIARPFPAFRKTFPLNAPTTQARLYIAASQHFEVRLNGWTVGAVGQDPPAGLIHAHTFDVTRLLQPRENVFGCAPQPAGPETAQPGAPLLLVQLEIEQAGGNLLIVVSDETWKTGSPGPIQPDRQPAPLHGPAASWMDPRYDDAAWQAANLHPDTAAAPVARPRPGG